MHTNFAELFDKICACEILQILSDISHQYPKYHVEPKNKYRSWVAFTTKGQFVENLSITNDLLLATFKHPKDQSELILFVSVCL